MRALVDAEFPRLPTVRGDLVTVVAKAVKKDPGQRYASATAFAADLRRYLDHELISARSAIQSRLQGAWSDSCRSYMHLLPWLSVFCA